MEPMVNSAICKEMAHSRKIVQKYGQYFGQMLFTIIAVNPDIKYKEDIVADRNTLRKEVYAYLVKAIDIKSIEFAAKDLDGQPKIIINKEDNDPNLVFPIVEPEFTKATRQNVSECIERACRPNSTPMFFAASELPMLTELLKSANQGAMKFYDDMAKKMTKLFSVVASYQDQTERLKNDYLRQCGVEDTTTEVHATITIEENQ